MIAVTDFRVIIIQLRTMGYICRTTTSSCWFHFSFFQARTW